MIAFFKCGGDCALEVARVMARPLRLILPAAHGQSECWADSMAAPHFDGSSDDRRALQLMAYSYTQVWLAALFGLVPGLRWLDVLGFYGIYIFSVGLPRMLRMPKDNLDVFTLVAPVLTISMAALHGWLVHFIAPMELVKRLLAD